MASLSARVSAVRSVVASLAVVGDEQALVRRIREGDEQAFRALFDDYYVSLCGFVFSYVRNRDAAQEIVADVFLGIWTRHADWQPKGALRPYLLAAARNRAINYLKAEHVRDRWTARWASQPPAEDETGIAMGERERAADVLLERGDLAAQLRRAVHELPERRRLVLTLRWQHGMTYAEIAHVLGISAKGVEVQLRRALHAIRARLLPSLEDA